MNQRRVVLVRLALAAFVTIGIAPAVRAQNVTPAPTTEVGLAVGAALPQGERLGALDLGGGPNAGFAVVGSVGLRPHDAPVRYRMEVQYTRLGLAEERRIEVGGDGPVIADGHASILAGTANIVLAMPTARRARPYLIGGLGIYRLSSAIHYTTPTGGAIENRVLSPSETKFGLNGGAGLELSVGSLHTFVEARFHSVFTQGKKANIIPITFGMTF